MKTSLDCQVYTILALVRYPEIASEQRPGQPFRNKVPRQLFAHPTSLPPHPLGTGADAMAAWEIIALSAGLAGVLDIATTATVMTRQGMPIKRLLQFIASGALGSRAFEGGKGTAGLGLLFHFLIAFVAATIYYAASRKIPSSLDHPASFGALYGIMVHVIMSRIVVPFSRAPKREFSLKAFLTQLVIHIFCVGLPIALTQSYLSR